MQVYMPDFKYFDPKAAKRYSAATDYPEAASAAIKEMFRQVGPYVLDDRGLMKRGVLIRHLILPGRAEDARDVIDFAADEAAMEKIMASARRTARILFVFILDFPPIFSVLFRSDTRGRGQDRLHRSRQAAPNQLYYNIQ